MPVCVPIKDMRDTAAFAALVHESAGPVTVTKNGYAEIITLRPDDYDRLSLYEAKCKLLERILLAESQMATGDCEDAFTSLDAMRSKHGI